jgi:plastocyanin
MKKRMRVLEGCLLFLMTAGLAAAQTQEAMPAGELKLRVAPQSSGTANHRTAPAVVWLTPLPGTPALPFVSTGHYTLLQKNRTFVPHLQVIPVGGVVSFPNADPFFHNVFSLYEGKRFDLGLYEAGSSKSVTFSREGASYIFCNIHPDMSAVVLALSTPLYAIATLDGSFTVRGVPAGDYRMHLWMEGVPQATLESLSRTLHFSESTLNLGTLDVPLGRPENESHKNKFGEPYDSHSHSTY